MQCNIYNILRMQSPLSNYLMSRLFILLMNLHDRVVSFNKSNGKTHWYFLGVYILHDSLQKKVFGNTLFGMSYREIKLSITF